MKLIWDGVEGSDVYLLYAKETGGEYANIATITAPVVEINFVDGIFNPIRGKHIFFIVKARVIGPNGPAITLPSNEIAVDVPFIGPTNLRVE